MSIKEIASDLYSSEINFTISTFWDAGYTVKLGDKLNGYSVQRSADTLEEAFEILKEMALIDYPDSEFAKKYR